MIDPDYHGETGKLLHTGGKKDYVWSIGDPLGCLLVLLCTVIKISRELQQPNPDRMTKGTYPSEMKEGEESRPAEVPPKSAKNIE